MNRKKLGVLATYVNGFAFKPDDWNDKGLPIIRIQDLTGTSYQLNYYDGDYPQKIEINDGDVLISWSASLGVYIWNRGKALLNQHIFKVVFNKEEIDKEYFVYAVKYNLDSMVLKMHGATMKHIVKNEFDNIEVPYPPIDKQRKIASILKKTDNLIDKRKLELEQLDLLIKSRFVEMFGDPTTNTKKWLKGTIRDIVTEVKYGTSKPACEGGKYKYIRMNNITYNGELDLTDLKYIDITKNEVEKCIVRKGDLLFNRTNSKELVGKTCVFNQEEDMVIAGYIIRVRMNKKALPEYLSAVLNSKYGKETLFGMCKAIVGQANINAQELQDIKIVIPPVELQQEFVKFKEQVDKLKFEVEKSLNESQLLFNSLMQKYFG